MIDLRSDTLTRPTLQMRNAMYAAEVGDAGREDPHGRSEDPTVNRLEDLAARLMGKEAAIFVPSGTMANLVALMTHCSFGQFVGVEKKLHVYHNEKAAFNIRPGGLLPLFYESNPRSGPDLDSIETLIVENKISLLCLENTHNYAGGTCIDKASIDTICQLAQKNGIAVHLDGARMLNASLALNTPEDELAASVDSVMFCLSKGLGAPVGSLLCGTRQFIRQAGRIRKSLGGTMRQAGILAAAGIVAIRQEKDRLIEDHANAQSLARNIAHTPGLVLSLDDVQTNMVRLDVSPSGYDAQSIQQGLEERGVKASAVSENLIRMVTYRDVGRQDMADASNIINEYFETLLK